MFLFFIKFKFLKKNGVSEKIKAHLPQNPAAFQQFFRHTFLILLKIFFAPPPFKREDRDYAFYMSDYKGETVKLLPFYVTDFLFTGLQTDNILRKLTSHEKLYT